MLCWGDTRVSDVEIYVQIFDTTSCLTWHQSTGLSAECDCRHTTGVVVNGVRYYNLLITLVHSITRIVVRIATLSIAQNLVISRYPLQ